VTVKGGDNLSKIAAANGTSWKAIYELNKDVIGGNPNLIRPGQVLKMP
jgi:nucleoid-associated protein YgaU